MAGPIPVILCGKSPQIAQGVKANLQPEYEVVHVILSPEAGVAEIPKLLAGESLEGAEENLGTKNYAATPAAVVMGAGYEDAHIEEMRKACAGKSSIPWIRPDLTKPTPPLGPAYGKAMVDRVKVTLKELADSGEMNTDAVHYY